MSQEQATRGPFSWFPQTDMGRGVVRPPKKTAPNPAPGTPMVNLQGLQNQAVLVVGESWRKMQEYNDTKPLQLQISQFARVLPGNPVATNPSPLIPVQFFVKNSVDPTGRYHEGKPIFVRTPTEQQPYDSLPLTDLRPIGVIYEKPLSTINAGVLVNTLQQNLAVRLCALENEDWAKCQACSLEPGGQDYVSEEEQEAQVDQLMNSMMQGLSEGVVRYCHFSCADRSAPIAPECGSFTVVALRGSEGTRFLLLPSDNELEYKLFILGRYGLPTNLDAIHAINWDKVPLFQQLRQAAVNQPTPCGAPRDTAYMRYLVKQLVARGYSCHCDTPNLKPSTKTFLYERAQLSLNK